MRILLVCAAGMSTGLLVGAMQKAALDAADAVEVQAVSTEALEDALPGSDVILVGPQVRHRFERLSEQATRLGKPIGLIPPRIYGTMDGPAALKLAHELYEQALTA